MKKILSAIIALYLIVPAVKAQDDEIRPKAIGVSFFLNDFITPDRIRTTSLSQVISSKRFAKIKEMAPGMAVTYFKGVRKHIDVAASLGASFLRYPMPNKSFSDNSLLLEANASLNLKLTTEKYWVQPYLVAGVGAHKYRGYYGAFLPLGLGVKVNLLDEAHLFIMSTYRVPVTNETANYHLQHSIGIAGRLGKKKEPVVIEAPRPPADTDADGIIDSLDKCPTVKGIEKYQGCPIPDTDKDGINDEEDKCPTVPGLARYKGCPIPDTDKDGINDEEDKCPTVAGVARYQGCPVPDTDGDGVNDEEDKCVTVPGVKENFGCPVITEEVKQKVNMAAKNILFVTGSSKLQSKSFKGLNEVAQIMKDNPAMSLNVDGHTDNVGNDDKNLILSQGRADAVKTYLAGKGIDAGRITATGFGETKPVADNKTAAGRQKNRRSELTLSYYK
ncbi:MAG: OmpA family protein [Sphingobacteriales bacterium]|nr:OmpA family protein [Sphingobacteriales bacterium]